METYYRKHRGWNGTIYYVRMSEREAEERRKIGVVLCTILMPPNYGAVLRVLRGTYQILLTPCLWTQ